MRRALVILACLAAACGSSGSGSSAPPYQPAGKAPAAAGRKTPPPAMADHALAVGAAAPAIALADDHGARWTLGDAQAKHARVMLVFYRGDW